MPALQKSAAKEKRRGAGRLAALAAALVLLAQPAIAQASGQADSSGKAAVAAQASGQDSGAETADAGASESASPDGENTAYSLSDEQLDELLDFVKEKWDAGKLEEEGAIREAIEEGEAQFGIVLQDSVRDQIADGMAKLNALGLDHDVAIGLAKKLYREHGDKITENIQKIYEEYAETLTDSVEKAIEEQVVEPAKEAAKAAVENTAKTFWQDLKNSVVNFFKNIFS